MPLVSDFLLSGLELKFLSDIQMKSWYLPDFMRFSNGAFYKLRVRQKCVEPKIHQCGTTELVAKMAESKFVHPRNRLSDRELGGG